MREYKFRAWDKDNKEMLYQGSNATHNNGVMDCRIVFDELWFGVLVRRYGEDEYEYRDNCELMQYTGLLDKNGQELWESDIIENEYKEKHLIVWDGTGFRAALDGSKKAIYSANEYWFEACKKIGNRWDNPELLKEVSV